MEYKDVSGRVHSFQSLGAVDGPGVRFTVFLSGCNLRCSCCHNPDTWNIMDGEKYTAEEIYNKVTRYKEYFGKEGGITLTGGEPLLQAEFAEAIFKLCKDGGINTCLDTSGSILTPDVKKLLSVTDRVLLDIKYQNDELYRREVGCSERTPLAFLDYINEIGIKTTLRRVIIPTLNDDTDSTIALCELANCHPCVDKIELLPFRKICTQKYDSLGIPFPLAHIDLPPKEKMDELAYIVSNFFHNQK